jgi:hypothetical protein
MVMIDRTATMNAFELRDGDGRLLGWVERPRGTELAGTVLLRRPMPTARTGR